MTAIADPTASSRSRAGTWVVYGGVPWDTPWLNDQQLAHALAHDGPALYVEPPRSPLGGLRRGPGAAVVRPRLRAAEGGVHVLTTVSPPKASLERVQRAAAPMLRAQVRWGLRRLGAPPPAAAVAMTPAARWFKGAAGERRFAGFVSDWLPAGSDLLHQDQATLTRASRAFWDAADVLCATSQPLVNELRSRGYEAALVEHGFDDGLAPCYDEAPAPPLYARIGRPILALAGRLNRRLDLAVLERLAEGLDGGSLVLIGPLSERDRSLRLDRLLARHDVHHVPAQSRERLPAWLRGADVLLVPYVADEWSRYSSPMKIWDYLYAGAPIVGHGCPPLVALGEPLAYHADTPDGVAAAVARALDEARDPAVVERRRRLALANTWRGRVEQLRAAVAAEPRTPVP